MSEPRFGPISERELDIALFAFQHVFVALEEEWDFSPQWLEIKNSLTDASSRAALKRALEGARAELPNRRA